MSDMSQGPAVTKPGMAGQGMAKPPMEQMRSPHNSTDMAMMAKRGALSGTYGQAMETLYGIKWDDPVQTAVEKIIAKNKTAAPMDKAMAMPPPGGAPGGPPGGAPGGSPGGMPPQGASQPQAGGSPIASMMRKYGG